MITKKYLRCHSIRLVSKALHLTTTLAPVQYHTASSRVHLEPDPELHKALVTSYVPKSTAFIADRPKSAAVEVVETTCGKLGPSVESFLNVIIQCFLA